MKVLTTISISNNDDAGTVDIVFDSKTRSYTESENIVASQYEVNGALVPNSIIMRSLLDPTIEYKFNIDQLTTINGDARPNNLTDVLSAINGVWQASPGFPGNGGGGNADINNYENSHIYYQKIKDSDPIVIGMQGTSLSAGYGGDGLDGGYDSIAPFGALESILTGVGLDAIVENKSTAGDRTIEGLTRNLDYVPDVIILEYAHNDSEDYGSFGAIVPLVDFRANLKEIALRYINQGVYTIFLLACPPKSLAKSYRVSQYQQIVKELGIQLNVPVVDSVSLNKQLVYDPWDAGNAADSVHLNHMSYSILGSVLAPILLGTQPIEVYPGFKFNGNDTRLSSVNGTALSIAEHSFTNPSHADNRFTYLTSNARYYFVVLDVKQQVQMYVKVLNTVYNTPKGMSFRYLNGEILEDIEVLNPGTSVDDSPIEPFRGDLWILNPGIHFIQMTPLPTYPVGYLDELGFELPA